MSVPPLVSTDWLAAHMSDPNIRIVDVRWYLFDNTKTGRGEYLNGHIPGAVFLDVDTDLSAPRGQGPGRHPLPKPEVFAAAASRAGISHDTHVIAYDDSGAGNAARVWWLLRYFGHDRVSLLDGGITQWIADKRPLETSVPSFPVSSFVPHPRPEMVANLQAVDAYRHDPKALVLDVRVPERYEGKIEPIDPRAGHVPGAKNAPIGGNLNSAEDMRFRSSNELRQRFEKLGADRAEKIVCYCGSGVNACQSVFALNLAGFASLLYEGSWSDWSSHADCPAATGPNP
ncbi:MAG: sulfurtransferase [Chloroflexi bacterium]|nr:sulfurtransferase [Chloroflexota bacterium]